MLFPSKDFVAWHKDAVQQVTRGAGMPYERCSVEITIYAPDRRASDLTNKAESIMDLLVDTGVVSDDNWFVCDPILLKFGGVDKTNPRAEIIIDYETPQMQTLPL